MGKESLTLIIPTTLHLRVPQSLGSRDCDHYCLSSRCLLSCPRKSSFLPSVFQSSQPDLHLSLARSRLFGEALRSSSHLPHRSAATLKERCLLRRQLRKRRSCWADRATA